MRGIPPKALSDPSIYEAWRPHGHSKAIAAGKSHHLAPMAARAQKYSGKVLPTQEGSLMSTATPPRQTSEKFIAIR